MKENDCLRRFLFEDFGVRGEWVRLEQSWLAIKQHQQGPDQVVFMLGEALVAATMLSATIKFKGSIILQAQGNGPFKTLVAQASDQQKIRGLVRSEADVPAGSLEHLFGDGHLILTIKAEANDPYQGVVPLVGERLSDAVESYFKHSEQLNTRLWLSADESSAVGLLLQELPGQNLDREDWNRIEILANTLKMSELHQLDCESLLFRLFHQEKVKLYPCEPVEFECSCSVEKIENTLFSMGQEELAGILDEYGQIDVDCEFCGRRYRFDSIDIENLFANLKLSGGASNAKH